MIDPYQYMRDREEILKDFDAFCDAIEGKAAQTFSGRNNETADRLAKYSSEDPRIGDESEESGGDGVSAAETTIDVPPTEVE